MRNQPTILSIDISNLTFDRQTVIDLVNANPGYQVMFKYGDLERILVWIEPTPAGTLHAMGLQSDIIIKMIPLKTGFEILKNRYGSRMTIEDCRYLPNIIDMIHNIYWEISAETKLATHNPGE
tara:strand:- start:71 stop:439 length:369 start_codon:yes stop_codon:yes gene_type:complete